MKLCRLHVGSRLKQRFKYYKIYILINMKTMNAEVDVHLTISNIRLNMMKESGENITVSNTLKELARVYLESKGKPSSD